jgi:hypothetical protein
MSEYFYIYTDKRDFTQKIQMLNLGTWEAAATDNSVQIMYQALYIVLRTKDTCWVSASWSQGSKFVT